MAIRAPSELTKSAIAKVAQAALNARLTDGGTVTWTGTGDWTPGVIDPMTSDPMICVDWMDPR